MGTALVKGKQIVFYRTKYLPSISKKILHRQHSQHHLSPDLILPILLLYYSENSLTKKDTKL